MCRRLVLKTALITSGILILAFALLSYFFLQYQSLETKHSYTVYIASKDISAGETIVPGAMEKKAVRQSDMSRYMISDSSFLINKVAVSQVKSGDYIRSYDVTDKIINSDEKIIVLELDPSLKLANLLAKNSLVDIKVEQKDTVPMVVLSKVLIQDILDENGVSMGNAGGSAKKTYAKLILNDSQRDRLYAAKSLGKLMFELYIDTAQEPRPENFSIPNYMKK